MSWSRCCAAACSRQVVQCLRPAQRWCAARLFEQPIRGPRQRLGAPLDSAARGVWRPRIALPTVKQAGVFLVTYNQRFNNADGFNNHIRILIARNGKENLQGGLHAIFGKVYGLQA